MSDQKQNGDGDDLNELLDSGCQKETQKQPV